MLLLQTYPIFVLFNIDKIFERIMYTRLCKFIEHNTVLDLKLTIWISTKKFNITLIHLTENSIMEDVVAEYLSIFRKPMIM